ncbi:C-type lectin domain family 2 member B-like isoform X2 [Calonectris borealis]|uniref:C-type lectin domain family 2 member B-like isoform X2 n=1 Tax=Calonectris borealis TaxID=1323832 RepID=UPI003F4BA44A
MAGEIVYADLRHLGDGFSPAEKRHIFQGSLQPATTSITRQGSEIRERNHTERCLISSIMRYFCKPRGDSPAAGAGCKLCPQDWQLHGDRCYWLSKEVGNWTQGRKGCEDQKSQLVEFQEKKEKEYIRNITGGSTRPVWIGLMSISKEWRWVSDTPLNTEMFGALQEMDKGCGTLKDDMLEGILCSEEHKWVCQKDPFQLSPSMAGDGEKCDDSV